MPESDARSVTQGLCESRGGRAGLPDSNGPYGLCRRKNIELELEQTVQQTTGPLPFSEDKKEETETKEQTITISVLMDSCYRVQTFMQNKILCASTHHSRTYMYIRV